jgi:hypothetical protein
MLSAKANKMASPDDVAAKLVAEIATRGPAIRKALVDAVPDGAVGPGHMIDALMTAAASFERHVSRVEMDAAFSNAIEILWLARAIAFSQGKIVEQSVPQA